ncbi:MAG: AbrB/MazE/SpoVT family DNA-binding domain-containing protein [Candidatus Thiodiazotropha sp. (ex Ctena orbiculata)]|nr:AbrB/MazE/SpoVT family DNA-binding domain-containing protein [Candidatus Thiodiazotropha taylori]MCG8025907.1 AbrB/MazE/SpoVT family DNA-binding domain-containing protein [Candidatus Thiodiazotropha endolucinida]
MKSVVKMWGNSASVRIPAPLMKSTNLSIDSAVDVREENGCIVIAPILDDEIDLHKLLAGVTPDNIHSEVDFGQAVGDEAL